MSLIANILAKSSRIRYIKFIEKAVVERTIRFVRKQNTANLRNLLLSENKFCLLLPVNMTDKCFWSNFLENFFLWSICKKLSDNYILNYVGKTCLSKIQSSNNFQIDICFLTWILKSSDSENCLVTKQNRSWFFNCRMLFDFILIHKEVFSTSCIVNDSKVNWK